MNVEECGGFDQLAKNAGNGEPQKALNPSNSGSLGGIAAIASSLILPQDDERNQMTPPISSHSVQSHSPTFSTDIELSGAELNELAERFPYYAETIIDNEYFKTLSLEGVKAMTLPNGKTLHPVEVVIVRFYANDGFKLINGVLGNDKQLVNYFYGRLRGRIPEKDVTIPEGARQIGLELGKIMASALNKLPSTNTKLLFRGSALPESKIEEYRPGSIIKVPKFSSTSRKEGIASQFATTTNLRLENSCEAIYIIENPKSAKNIDGVRFRGVGNSEMSVIKN
ncbi:MAG: hypothetical protein WCF65_08630 [Parachlamydiaceae bacterium]